jgi:hypothetical protein
MPTHSAKVLFEKNISSAQDCIDLFDAISKLKPAKVNIDWIIRAAVVFIVSALDTYFHDKVKYRVGHFSLVNLPPALAKFEIPIADLTAWEGAERKGNVLRNWVTEHLSTRPLQSPAAIAEALKLAGMQALWDTIEPDKGKRDSLLSEFNLIVKRRNQIAHEGDRMTSRRSGKALRAIHRKEVVRWMSFATSLVDKVETAFPG